MKTSTVSLTDLLILRDLFARDNDFYIIDPANRVNGDKNSIPTFRNSNNADNNTPAFVADVRKGEIKLYTTSFDHDQWVSFDYINNPDGTIRWFYPSSGLQAGHLALYNSGTLKSRLYKAVTKLAWKFGQSSRLASGTFKVQQKLFETVKKNCGMAPHEAVAFFTGTRGATRKMVIEIHDEYQTTGFIKMPLTPQAELLIDNEYKMVNSLNKYDFTTLSLPKSSKRINGHARLSNIKPAVTIPADRITAIHVRALAELYAISHDRITTNKTAAWDTIESNIYFLCEELVFINDLNKQKTRELIRLMKEVYNSIAATEPVAVSISHGDFTPWNMYCDEQRLYVYDWEMAKNGIPMLFDLFHFTYQSVILQHRKNYTEVKETINSWKKQPLVQQLVHKYQINLLQHQSLYLLFTVSHYLRQYLSEKELLMQSHWMVDAWTEALQDCLEQLSKKANQS